ncbi:unnamed protein product [Protopolystoma xenopodis]|uniref:Uncharacterized protein n=1 Tax=Protopolystoma xenopodis TaxID=117903 RepID=A0A448WG55_9PLAT|nr:unnamed protein product [Protopolystoma xenopodis]
MIDKFCRPIRRRVLRQHVPGLQVFTNGLSFIPLENATNWLQLVFFALTKSPKTTPDKGARKALASQNLVVAVCLAALSVDVACLSLGMYWE